MVRERQQADHNGAVTAGPIRAAQYLRKSTDHQRYSIENQSEANHCFATRCGMTIVRTYSDEGVSGLTFKRRDGLRRLIADVQSGNSDFSVILVYDVSRWGRFQDTDESAFYEHICKKAGYGVHYCAEPFENDGSAFAAIVKTIKRAMAGEYSRELSVKTFTGQLRVFGLASAPAPYPCMEPGASSSINLASRSFSSNRESLKVSKATG